MSEQRLDQWLQRRAGRRSGIPRRPASGPAPLSFAQERLWFLDQLVPGSTAYSLPLLLRLSGRLDTDALRMSLDRIVERHEALRTRLPLVDGEPAQVVAPGSALDLPVVDLSAEPEPLRGGSLDRVVAEHVARPFDLAQGPLLRAALIRLHERDHALLLLVHHAVADAWSLLVLIGELVALYGGEEAGLPELPIAYADYGVWQRAPFATPAMAGHLDYWRRRLEGPLPVLHPPVARARPAVQTFRGATHRRRLPEALLAGLSNLARRSGATLYMTV